MRRLSVLEYLLLEYTYRNRDKYYTAIIQEVEDKNSDQESVTLGETICLILISACELRYSFDTHVLDQDISATAY